MSKKVHYHGASTVVKANPEGGGKIRHTKLGALQIAAMNWASRPLAMFALWQPTAEKVRDEPVKVKAKKKRSRPLKTERELVQEKFAKAKKRKVKGKIQSWAADDT